MIYNIVLFATLIPAVLFLLAGLSLMLFGRKHVPSTGVARVEIEFFGNSVSTPYQTSFILAILGIVLMIMTHSLLLRDFNDTPDQASVRFSFFSSAYAHNSNISGEGWVYFGYEKSPQNWNFEIVKGSYRAMRAKKSVVLKSVRKMNVREDHFGHFTGTLFGVFDRAPKKKKEFIRKGECIRPVDVVSVGRKKVWVKFKRTKCP